MVKSSQILQNLAKNYRLWLLVIGIAILISTIIIIAMKDQTTHDFDNFYYQQHAQTLDKIKGDAIKKGDLSGATFITVGPSLSILFTFLFSYFATIPSSIVFIILGSLLKRSSKHTKNFAITVTIISAIALCVLPIIVLSESTFLQYIDYLFSNPSLFNTTIAIAIVATPTLLLAILIKSIYTLSRIKHPV